MLLCCIWTDGWLKSCGCCLLILMVSYKLWIIPVCDVFRRDDFCCSSLEENKNVVLVFWRQTGVCWPLAVLSVNLLEPKIVHPFISVPVIPAKVRVFVWFFIFLKSIVRSLILLSVLCEQDRTEQVALRCWIVQYKSRRAWLSFWNMWFYIHSILCRSDGKLMRIQTSLDVVFFGWRMTFSKQFIKIGMSDTELQWLRLNTADIFWYRGKWCLEAGENCFLWDKCLKWAVISS